MSLVEDAGQTRAYYRRRKRRAVADEKAFAALDATPHDFGNVAENATSSTNLTLPANVRLAAAVNAILSQSDVIVNIGPNKSPECPAAAADEIFQLGFGEKNGVVSVFRATGAPSGTFTLYRVDTFGRATAIGTATFTV